MYDPFEESLRDLLKADPAQHDDGETLDRVLKTANRQVGMGDLFGLMGRSLEALMIALNSGSAHVMPTSRTQQKTANKAD